jgi:hypothetical protein
MEFHSRVYRSGLVAADLSYDANYGWKAASLNTDSLGNVIQNGQGKQVAVKWIYQVV